MVNAEIFRSTESDKYPSAKKQTGEWVSQTVEGEIMQAQCSRCKCFALQPYGWGGHFSLKFCPFCGAKMGGEENG